MASYSMVAFALLRSAMASSPPRRSSHLKTSPAKYQAKVGGVLDMESAPSCAW